MGDSILDNAPYTRPKPDTTAHLQQLLSSWSVRRLAVDGSVMADIAAQLDVLEEQPAVIVLSVGGNDAVDHIGVLDQQGTSSAEVLAQLLQISNDFSS